MELHDLNPFLRFASQMLYETVYNSKPVLVSDCRLFFVLEGSARISLEGKQYTLDPNSLFYCCGGSCYTIHTDQPLRLIILNFDLSQRFRTHTQPFAPSRDTAQWERLPIMREEITDSPFLSSHLYLAAAGSFADLLRQIVEEFSSGDRYSFTLCSASLKSLLIQLHRHLSGQIPPKIAQVQAYIQSHYASPISNKELAELVGYHEYYLNRIFQQHMGHSLHSYLLRVRLNQASRLILNSDLELQAISDQVGFSSYPHFSGFFKQIYGLSPAQYRKRLRSNI